MMGCSPSLQYACGGDEFPVHEVTLTLAFYLGRFEVTQAQWTAVMGSNPSYFAGYADSSSRPVERVSWNMAQAFEAATGLRLPSEAEREFACRAGTTSAISNGSNDEGSLAEVAWYNQSAGGQSRVVGLKPPNRLGFHDMHGNVWEWVEDWYAGDYYSVSPLVDPSGPPNGSSKVRRGGSWNSPAFNCLTSKRNATSPDSQFFQTGLRVARSP
jgi:formylglycine-generating enzyme required for sulfatase activity